MTKMNVITMSDDTESITGSNSVECNNTITIVSKEGHEYECSSAPPPHLQTHQPIENRIKSSFKPDSQPHLPSSSQSLPITSNKPATMAVPSPSSPKPNNTTAVVPVTPLSTALLINNNAVESGVHQEPVSVRPHNGESRHHPVGVTFSNPHGKASIAFKTFSKPQGEGNSAFRHVGGTSSQSFGVGNDHQHYQYSYLRQMDHRENHYSSRRTIDFLSGMEGSTSAQRHVPREIPQNETVAEWGAMLRLGNEGSRH